jgi:hypothetical protein
MARQTPTNEVGGVEVDDLMENDADELGAATIGDGYDEVRLQRQRLPRT